MTDAPGSMLGHAALAACLLLAGTTDLAAQPPLADPPSTPQFLSRYDLRIDLAALAEEDPRFTWDHHAGITFDVVDYVRGRFTMVGNYQTLMGSELQHFDPYQTNYQIGGMLSVRLKRAELGAVFLHTSRHLGDRPKTIGIAMNTLGGRVLTEVRRGRATMDLRGELAGVTRRDYVDYTWVGRAHVGVSRPLGPRVEMIARASGDTVGVDPAIAGRGQQNGGRLEGGIRIRGGALRLELFAGVERVVDADPLDRLPRSWGFAGFRLVN